jgi:3-oxoacyl-[acyl-carrier protein] reductase
MVTSKKTAIITGSSRGIGAAIGRRFSSDGFNVVINYSSRLPILKSSSHQLLL